MLLTVFNKTAQEVADIAAAQAKWIHGEPMLIKHKAEVVEFKGVIKSTGYSLNLNKVLTIVELESGDLPDCFDVLAFTNVQVPVTPCDQFYSGLKNLGFQVSDINPKIIILNFKF